MPNSCYNIKHPTVIKPIVSFLALGQSENVKCKRFAAVMSQVPVPSSHCERPSDRIPRLAQHENSAASPEL